MSGLRWGILSTAHIARTQAVPAMLEAADAEIVAVGSRSLERAKAFATEFDIPRAHSSYEALLEDPDVDAVYIGLPNSLHRDWTIAAARAGKHVLCEKPIARTAADAELMVHACREAGVVLMEAFMWRHHAQQARVRELLDSDAIGAPVSVNADFTYRIDPERPNVRLQADLEGGSLMDVGCYPVNLARWVFADEPLEAVGRQHVDPDFGVETSFGGVLRFPEGRLAMVDSSFAQLPMNRYEIAGTEGRIVVERAFRPDDQPGRITVFRGTDQTVEDVPPANQFAYEADHFAASVRAGRLLPPAEDGVAQARVIDALYASASGSERR